MRDPGKVELKSKMSGAVTPWVDARGPYERKRVTGSERPIDLGNEW